MLDMLKLMKKAAGVQKDLKKTQAELAARVVEFSSPKGEATVEATGNGMIKSVSIDPQIVDPSRIADLESAVLLAANGALKEASAVASQEMSKVTQGLGVPGLLK